MKILMMTNTYLPHVGGVARSVSTFADEYLRSGHEVLVVAPRFAGRPLPRRAEAIVERVAAIQNFNGSDFSVRLPLAATTSDRIQAFDADIIHAHHPFLLGDTALRLGARRNVPVVFTHHTRYEDYSHYVPFDSPALKQAAVQLSTEFANLCSGVVAPSESIAALIRRRGVMTPVKVVPTGVDVRAFAAGQGRRFREKMGIPARAFVIGHVGRLAREKNLSFLARAVMPALRQLPESRFLIVGSGPEEEELREMFARQGLADSLLLAGQHTGAALCDAYAAMDVFAFSSRSETQGMVVAEAMAAGVPVVALRASGVREVVRDGVNGFLLPTATPAEEFGRRLVELGSNLRLRCRLSSGAAETAPQFSRERCAGAALEFYEEVRRSTRRERLLVNQSPWRAVVQRLGVEWEILARNARTLTTALAS